MVGSRVEWGAGPGAFRSSQARGVCRQVRGPQGLVLSSRFSVFTARRPVLPPPRSRQGLALAGHLHLWGRRTAGGGGSRCPCCPVPPPHMAFPHETEFTTCSWGAPPQPACRWPPLLWEGHLWLQGLCCERGQRWQPAAPACSTHVLPADSWERLWGPPSCSVASSPGCVALTVLRPGVF